MWEDGLSDSEGASAVDVDNVCHFLDISLRERDRYAVRLANIVDEDRDLFVLEQLGEFGVVGIGGFGEVDG